MNSFNSMHKPNMPEVFDKDKFHNLVAERAYYKFEKRGFAEGHDLDDWLRAEAECKKQCFYWFQDVD